MKKSQVTSLHFAVRLRVLLKYGGQLILVFAVLTGGPFIFSLLVGEYRQAWIYGTVVIGAGLSGFILQRLEAPGNLQNNEALVLSAAIFIIAPLIAAIPLHLSGLQLSDAVFEAVSGITTTGLSTLPTVEKLPRTFLFFRAWLQWIGGLGIVVLSVALLLPQSRAGLRLFSGNWEKEDLITSAKTYARAVLKIYLLLTFLGIGVLILLGVDRLDAVTHILAAVSTGGFSTYDNSIGGLASWDFEAAVILFCTLGAVSLGLYYQVLQRGLRTLFANTEVIGLICMLFTASLLLSLFLYLLDGFSLENALRNGPLLACSAQTTAGFSSVNVAGLSPGSKLLLILMMTVGGNVGSTAGGIKIMRLLIIIKIMHLLIVRSGTATGAVIQPRYMGKRLETDEIERCFVLALLFCGIIFFSWLPFVIMGYPALDALFEVASACGTVGLSTGITSVELPVMLKTVLCLDMLMGRLEIIAFLVLLYPPTWYGKKRA
jgi:trk system potassium uptake protein TrkH